MRRVITKVGDIFSVEIDQWHKKFFQFVALDLLQLNSDVIRVFKSKFQINENPDLRGVVYDD
ncbi:MAG: hypothetical protein AAFY91_11365, partial [Bacteroidota bacterium]